METKSRGRSRRYFTICHGIQTQKRTAGSLRPTRWTSSEAASLARVGGPRGRWVVIHGRGLVILIPLLFDACMYLVAMSVLAENTWFNPAGAYLFTLPQYGHDLLRAVARQLLRRDFVEEAQVICSRGRASSPSAHFGGENVT